MIVEEHAHERSAAFSALNDDGPHGVPGLHEGDGARRLAARPPSDLGAELPEMPEVAPDPAPELADDTGIPDRLKDPLNAVGNIDDKTGEELLILGA